MATRDDVLMLEVDVLCRLGERAGVQTWPVVLDLYPTDDDAARADAAAKAADGEIYRLRLWDTDEPTALMAAALRVLSSPDRMIEVRIFGGESIRRICLARRANDHVVAIRDGRVVEVSTPKIGDVAQIGASIRRLFPDVGPITIDGFSTPANELAERLGRCGSVDEFADALHACGAHATDATTLAAALTSIRSRAEIVAVGRTDGIVIQSSGALAIFDTDRGRIVLSPSESPDGHVWSTMSPGSGHRIAQAVGLLIETMPGGWWTR